MLRIGRRAIVSVPNFGHSRIRAQVAFLGRMPVTKNLCLVRHAEHPCLHDRRFHRAGARCWRNDRQERRARSQWPAAQANLLAMGVEFVGRSGDFSPAPQALNARALTAPCARRQPVGCLQGSLSDADQLRDQRSRS
jgi:hypothetical protein